MGRTSSRGSDQSATMTRQQRESSARKVRLTAMAMTEKRVSKRTRTESIPTLP